MNRPAHYVPARGDIVWIDFTPQAGHEQSGRRPGLILSAASYNARAGLAVVCPLTKQAKGYQFEVVIPEGLGVFGVILADQVKSLDWRVRNAALITQAPESLLNEVFQVCQSVLLGAS